MSQEKTVLLLHWHCYAQLHLVWYVNTNSVEHVYQGLTTAAPPAYEHCFREPRWRVSGLLHARHTSDRRGIQGFGQ